VTTGLSPTILQLIGDNNIAGILHSGQVDLPYGGYVKLIDYVGSEESIIEAARMSTAKGFLGWGPKVCPGCRGEPTGAGAAGGGPHVPLCLKCQGSGQVPGDEKLLRYLWEHHHHTPFEMAELCFEIEAPIFVARQVFRHRTFSYNEFSQRYAAVGGGKPELSEEYAWSPPSGGWRIDAARAGLANRQGSIDVGEVMESEAAVAFGHMADGVLARVYREAWRGYRELLDAGVCKEQARATLPVGTFTRWRQKGNLRNWFHYFGLRLEEHAQLETRQVAAAEALFTSALFPRAWELFEETLPEPETVG